MRQRPAGLVDYGSKRAGALGVVLAFALVALPVSAAAAAAGYPNGSRSEEHTSELQSHSFISYAVFCLKKKKNPTYPHPPPFT